MKLQLTSSEFINTDEPIDISIPITGAKDNVIAWYLDAPSMKPVVSEQFVGEVAMGGAVNFRNIFFNPHGHGTHTECLGHITKEIFSVNRHLTKFFFTAQLISIDPRKKTNEEGEFDYVIDASQIIPLINDEVDALIIRTFPNREEKKHFNYSSTNPPYLDVECCEVMNKFNIRHLLIDLPSVDRESDGGVLAFHHKFWGVPENPQYDKTITELIYVKDSIPDGRYILDLQLAPFENDAAPSRPILYEIKKG